MPEVIHPGAEEQGEEEEEEEAAPTLCPRGLRSRGLAILTEGEPAGESTMAEGAERPDEVMERVELRFQEFLLSLELLRLRREGQRCNNRGLLVC